MQMKHGSSLKYDEPEIENVARGRSPSATFSTEGHHISMSNDLHMFCRMSYSLNCISSSETVV